MKAYLFTAAAALCLASVGHADDSSAVRPSREELHAAISAFAEAAGIAAPSPGQRPSEADRATIGACMKAKGFNPPHGRPPGPPPEQQPANQSSDSGSAS